MDTERDANGDLQWGPNFPTGSSLGEFIHSKGFKFGVRAAAFLFSSSTASSF